MEEKNRTAKGDLGSGNVKRQLFTLAFPAIVAQIINLLYNIVDRIYIGHIEEVGVQALTGVGLVTPILILISAFAALAAHGGAPRAAIAMGQKELSQAEKIIGNCFSVILLFAVMLTFGFYLGAPTLLRFFGGSDATLPFAIAYARIYVLGSIFVLITLGLNPFITTQGFAKVSMQTTLIGAVMNILLDPVFIFVFHLGVRGAAIATVLSQAISALWVLSFLTGKRTQLHLRRENMKLEAKVILPCLALGVSSFVMLSTESVLSMCFTSSLSKYGGDLAVGAMTILTSIDQFKTLPLSGICQGGQPLISFNFGAGNVSRVKEAFYTQFTVCVLYAFAFCAVIWLFPQKLAGIFTNDRELIEYTAYAMRIYMAVTFTTGFQISCQQGFLAMGEAVISLFLACLRKLILLIPLIFILPAIITSNQVFAVFLAEPISDFLAAVATTICFFVNFNRILKRGPKKSR